MSKASPVWRTPGAKVQRASRPEREVKDLAPKEQNVCPVATKWVGKEGAVAATPPGAWAHGWQKTSRRCPGRRSREKSPQKMQQRPKRQIVAVEKSSEVCGAKWRIVEQLCGHPG